MLFLIMLNKNTFFDSILNRNRNYFFDFNCWNNSGNRFT